ncbi:riboflavin biosynthesis protein RibF [Candidatus Omnitrophota bacterium]
MKIIYGISKIKRMRKPVVALGVFDGVHRAHIRILKYAAAAARRRGGKSVALTFWPHPRKVKSLYSLEHRLRLIEALGIDICVVIRFDRSFSKITADDFVRRILSGKLGAELVCVGRNFRFGHGACGDVNSLNRLSRLYGFKLKIFEVIRADSRPVSSTSIRRLIESGKLRQAESLLRRPVAVLGTVIRGQALGRRLGFPTANINPHHEVLPPSGVYAVRIIYNNRRLKGVCNIGRKPTLGNSDQKHIEVYIFNFLGNIYGKYLEIQFIEGLRSERKFADLDSLAGQLKKDVRRARECFTRH